MTSIYIIKKEPMATIKWSQVQAWLTKNPSASKSLVPFKAAEHEENVEQDGWLRTDVSPSTPLSAILLAQDAIYAATLPVNRRAILRDETTDLQEKAVLMLKGRQWPVRRTAEGISAAGIDEARSWPEQGWRAVAALREVQIIVINNDAKRMQFFPEDVRAWSPEIEVLVIDHECRYIWSKRVDNLCLWVQEKENDKWSIDWPLADGSMEELRAAAEACNESSSKLVKDVLRRRVGRAQSIKSLVAIKLSATT
jgi:hypothetical protein